MSKNISDIRNEMTSYLTGGFEHIFEQMNKSLRYYVMPKNVGLFKYLSYCFFFGLVLFQQEIAPFYGNKNCWIYWLSK